MTVAIGHPGAHTRRSTGGEAVARWHTRSFRLFTAGLVALVAAAWGGIVPFVGPVFGFSGDGTGSWYWDLGHALLALVPGAAGCLAALAIMGSSLTTRKTFGYTMGLSLAGLLAIASGAWFVIGPFAWPVLYSTTGYFAFASPLRELAYVVGYSLGPGLILAAAGGMAWGADAREVVTASEPVGVAEPAAASRPGTPATVPEEPLRREAASTSAPSEPVRREEVQPVSAVEPAADARGRTSDAPIE